MGIFDGNDNYGKPKSDYLTKLTTFDDAKLYEECNRIIWLSAFANNNPRSDYHWMASACYDECANRDKVFLYEKAYNKLIAQYR